MPLIGRPTQESNASPDGAQKPEAHQSHVAILRAARVRHKAIARGLQTYFDAVAAERIPSEFLEILSRMDPQPQ